jgi:hypothetical protein
MTNETFSGVPKSRLCHSERSEESAVAPFLLHVNQPGSPQPSTGIAVAFNAAS